MKIIKTILLTGIPVTILSFLSFGQAMAQSGEEIYKETCIACHGDNGKGTLPGMTPDFTKKNGRLSKKDAKLIKHIMEGFQSPNSQMAMPPKGGNDELTENDIKKVLQYLRKEFGG